MEINIIYEDLMDGNKRKFLNILDNQLFLDGNLIGNIINGKVE